MGIFFKALVIRVPFLVKLLAAEGFLKPISGKSLEETAEEYLKELINRNLVLSSKLEQNRKIKLCHIHDLVGDLCLREAQKQRFYNVISQHSLNTPQELSTIRRIVIARKTSPEEVMNAFQYMSLARSLTYESKEEVEFHNFRLLRIMLCAYLDNTCFLQDKFQLVNSRYIYLCVDHVNKIPSSLDLLWNLHTLIIEAYDAFEAPFEIWNMPLLRHLKFRGGLHLQYPPCGRNVVIMENLQTLKRVINFKCCKEVVKRIPNIKKLSVSYDTSDLRDSGFNNFCHLQKLESLQYRCNIYDENYSQQNLCFPHSLKKLKLDVSNYQNWEDHLEKIGSLPYLEKLSLANGCFNECKWETVEGQFPKLKSLTIEFCRNLKYWITESSHFPRLEHLFLWNLNELTEIPSEIGEIATMESITLYFCSDSIIFSAKKIVEEQEELHGVVVGLQVRVLTADNKKEDMQRLLAGPNFQIL